MNGVPMHIRRNAVTELAQRARNAIAAGKPEATPSRPLNMPPAYADRMVSDEGAYGCCHRVGSLGVVQVDGPMWYSPHAWAAWVGGGSIHAFLQAGERLAADPTVTRIVLNVHTPGGEANATGEIVDAVARWRDAKPVHARIYNTFSLGIAAVCMSTDISMSRTSECGSVGSVVWTYDDSEQHRQDGLRVVAAASPAGKIQYAPGVELGGEVQAELQRRIERCADDFIEAVARGRSIAPDAVRAWNAGDFFADDAVAAGLIDVVESEPAFWERVVGLAERDTQDTKPGRVAPAAHAGVAARTQSGGKAMPTTNKGGTPTKAAGGANAPKSMTADELLELARSSGNIDEDMIESLAAIVGTDEDEAGSTTEEEEETGTAGSIKPGAGANASGRPATFAQLDELVPGSLENRDALIGSMMRDGVGIRGAQARVQDATNSRLAKLEKMVAEKSAADAETSGFSQGTKPLGGNRGGGGGGKGGDATAEHAAAVQARMAEAKCERPAAVAWVARNNPSLNERVVAEANARREGAKQSA